MRKWMLIAGLAAAILAVAMLWPGARKPPAVDGSGSAARGPPHGAPSPEAVAETPDDAMHHGAVSEDSRLIVAYPVTMPRLQSYVAAVKEIRAAGTKDAALMAMLRKPGPTGEHIAGMGARLDAIAPVKAILDRHGLTGVDLVLMPQAVMAGRNAYSLEQEGRPLPPDQVNAGAAGLYRADINRMDGIAKAFLADLRYISGP